MKSTPLYKLKSDRARLFALSNMTQEEKEQSIMFWIRMTMTPAARKKEPQFHIKEEKKILKALESIGQLEFFENIDKLNILSMACFGRCANIYKYIKQQIDFSAAVDDKLIEGISIANEYLTSTSVLFETGINEIIVDFMTDKKVNDINKSNLYARCWFDFNIISGLFHQHCDMDVLIKKKNQLNDLVNNFEVDENVFSSTVIKLARLKHKNATVSFYDSVLCASYKDDGLKSSLVNNLLKNQNELYQSKEHLRFIMEQDFNSKEFKSRNKYKV